ncbi:RNA-binding S4 domain-containing protein [uncultured Roseibium sp.]|uniref:RNA-binding S4 domain-containing protein n=1 Tax=uncultured Roseibium sp. TaxID=1936171 RepID=UPI00262B5B51|nr:RNA-binding S4 domain-containing protein [uncultured Roseibium sp.]
MPAPDPQAAGGGLRIDKWLWYARVTKSRSLAQKLISSRHVRLNSDKVVTPSKTVKVGDVLTIALDRRILVLKVAALGSRRGPFEEARKLYEDMSPPPPPKEEQPSHPALREAGAGRPTKRDRRKIDAWRGDN